MESFLCIEPDNYSGIKIVNSIDVAQSKANRQMPPLIHSSQIPPKIKKCVDISNNFLEELGIKNHEFKILFDNLPHAVAIYKMVYDKKGKPVDYIPLESNQAYDNIHSFKRERIGQKAVEFNPKIKDDSNRLATNLWQGSHHRCARVF